VEHQVERIVERDDDALSEPVMRKWYPVLVAVPFPTFSAPVRAELIGRCATFDELATTILRVARRDNRPGGHFSVLSDLPEPLPEPLHAPLLQLAPELQDDAFEDVLLRLLPADNEQARELARSALREALELSSQFKLDLNAAASRDGGQGPQTKLALNAHVQSFDAWSVRHGKLLS
jgi:hypothetical protein